MNNKELAAAIRKGAAIRPQCMSGVFFDGVGSCALGAAHEAVFGVPLVQGVAGDYARLEREFPCLKEGNLALKIVTMNDDGWCREAIADWLDKLEPETKPADKQSFDSFMATVMQPVAVTV